MPADPLPILDHSSPIVTLQSHLLAEQARIPGSTGTLSWILSAMSISAKIIANKVRCARLEDVLGEAGSGNVQGEQQQKLDVISNNVLLRLLGGREGVAIVASEENEEPVIIRNDPSAEHRYCVLFDPLDGSSNLDVCGGVGTIFSILRHDATANDAQAALLQPGHRQVAAGYVLYGSSTVFVLTVGHGVDMFVLDPAVGAFMLVERGLRTPVASKSYSVNEGNRRTFPDGYQKYLDWAQERGYSSRYVGSMVADVHRILLKGADEKGAGRQAAADVRGQPDGHADRAGGRQGARGAGATHPGRAAAGHPRAHAGDPRQRRGSRQRGGSAGGTVTRQECRPRADGRVRSQGCPGPEPLLPSSESGGEAM